MVILLVSFACGSAFTPFADTYTWPTPEMDGRGHYQGLASNFVIAVVSGAVAGVSVSASEYQLPASCQRSHHSIHRSNHDA